jgi:hypothetical protein
MTVSRTPDPREPSPIGRQPEAKAPQGCGLCGSTGPLSKAHVPPQVAGNDKSVTRTHLRVKAGHIQRSSAGVGGMFTRALCARCNSVAGARYDNSYGQFHTAVATGIDAMSSGFSKRLTFGGITTNPALVVRSVLCGMFALSTQLRVVLPEAAADLAGSASQVRWPGDTHLLLAMNLADEHRAQGGMSAMRLVPPQMTRNSFAEIWFKPLAWALVQDDAAPTALGPSYFDVAGWTDVSHWINLNRPAPNVIAEGLTEAPWLSSFMLPGDDMNNWGLIYHHDSSTMILGDANAETGPRDQPSPNRPS